ncbi:MAG: hypothetical protein GY760_23040 [Deltaproteobacteria bacterium]|nr:hypothetical protein [Deltaproteobacteria bacterium]
MQDSQYKNILHMHVPSELDENILSSYDGFILGSVFCGQSRIDKNYSRWKSIIETLGNEKKEIYIQQPFYLYPDEKSLLDTMCTIGKKASISGIFTNSPGAALSYSDNGFFPILSRFTIKKRKRANQYFWERLLEKGVNTIECFAYDSQLIEDIENFSLPINIWKRDTKFAYNSFSPKCLIQHYQDDCKKNPEKCISGDYKLENEKKCICNTVSGNIIYNHCEEIIRDTKKENDVYVYNQGRYEL